MTATLEPASSVENLDVLDRAAGVELLGPVHGSGYRDGISLVRRADGQMIQLGPLQYAALEAADGRRNNAEIAEQMTAALGRRVDATHVARIGQKLASQGLLAGTEAAAPPRRNPLLALRWKVLITNPTVTRRMTAPFAFLFRPWLMWPILACFAVVVWFVLFDKGIAGAAAEAFHRPGLLLLIFAIGVASAGFHELGHAAACKYSGGTPGGMGVGLYLVWPAFYTDVTDTYRLDRRSRLRVDLGGLYFNTVIAVAITGVWLFTRTDALLLVVALQLLLMVKQLSPVIRADGYHILADLTGVPDLFAHIGPTMRRLIPGRRRETSALSGKARAIVTAWVLIIIPVLGFLMLGAVLVFPRLAASAWHSGRLIIAAMPKDAHRHGGLSALADALRIVALVLPVIGSGLVAQRIGRTLVAKGWSWSRGRPARRAVAASAGIAILAGLAWAWWPSGQYQPVRPTDRGTLPSFVSMVSRPAAATRPLTQAAVPPGRYLALAMIPKQGVTRDRPAMFTLMNRDSRAVGAVLSTAPTLNPTSAPNEGQAPGTALPFELPSQPGPGGTQALATNQTDGGVVYKVAYALVTVGGGDPVTNTNSAFAIASCDACTTVAVSFQLVLVVGQSNVIMPINAAGALNYKCPQCLTTALADQMVVTLAAQPSAELDHKLERALQRLDALSQLGGNASPAEIVALVDSVQHQIEQILTESGLLANPLPTTTPSSSDTSAPGASPSPPPGAVATASPTPTGDRSSSTRPAPTSTTSGIPSQRPSQSASPTPTSGSPAPSSTSSPATSSTTPAGQ
ncbi:MAG: hypothetical protein JO246_10840 [Frankiaceae bacterium]|nr:hypothetical protein [Frankiaceae bacterium]MBV9871291.1 hypothetical protein [Frankiaceae bacterium]